LWWLAIVLPASPDRPSTTSPLLLSATMANGDHQRPRPRPLRSGCRQLPAGVVPSPEIDLSAGDGLHHVATATIAAMLSSGDLDGHAQTAARRRLALISL
jgi:hypothetical protein